MEKGFGLSGVKKSRAVLENFLDEMTIEVGQEDTWMDHEKIDRNHTLERRTRTGFLTFKKL